MIIKNERLFLELSLDNGIYIEQCSNSFDRPVYYQDDGELFILKEKSTVFHSDSFRITDIDTYRTDVEELTSIALQCDQLKLRLRICFLNNLSDTISIIFQLADDNPAEKRRSFLFHSPFLANIHSADPEKQKVYYPSCPAKKRNGGNVMQLYSLVHLPLVITDANDEKGFAVSFPSLSTMGFAAQNRNLEFWGISGEQYLKDLMPLLRLNNVLTDIAEFSVYGLKNGWREAFSRTREAFRADFDFREYERQDLAWFRNSLIHHFTFLYSKEAYDYESDVTDIARLAKEGEEFGGYDTVTLWHQYPRLGVDQRTQWDFFQDYPGSVQGLAEAIKQAHENGIRVLLPYKPWDVNSSQSMDSIMKEISSLLKDTGADGFFLDTMSQAPVGFRQAADDATSGIVFCSEGHPNSMDSLALLTASWDQLFNIFCMPEVDLLRFILPEHTAPQISRWLNAGDKDALIKRAVFSGVGLVIWQDVFGSWLPYSSEQKEMIRKYKALWYKYQGYFQGEEPIPLYPAQAPYVYCNRFTNHERSGYIYTFYNDNDETFDGLLILHRDSDATACKCLWGDSAFSLENNQLAGSLGPGEVAVVFVV